MLPRVVRQMARHTGGRGHVDGQRRGRADDGVVVVEEEEVVVVVVVDVVCGWSRGRRRRHRQAQAKRGGRISGLLDAAIGGFALCYAPAVGRASRLGTCLVALRARAPTTEAAENWPASGGAKDAPSLRRSDTHAVRSR
jgi:hypothetical protein